MKIWQDQVKREGVNPENEKGTIITDSLITDRSD